MANDCLFCKKFPEKFNHYCSLQCELDHAETNGEPDEVMAMIHYRHFQVAGWASPLQPNWNQIKAAKSSHFVSQKYICVPPLHDEKRRPVINPPIVNTHQDDEDDMFHLALQNADKELNAKTRKKRKLI